MGGRKVQVQGFDSGYKDKDVVISSSGIKLEWDSHGGNVHPTGLFASVGQAGFGIGISPNPPLTARDSGAKLPLVNSSMQYVLMPETGFRAAGIQGLLNGEVAEEGLALKGKKMKGFKLKFKIANPSLRRLMSGAIAGAVSRTVVAPLETIRTHLMVGSCGHNTAQVFQSIMQADGWKGLFRGNFVNIIRVAPSKAIEVSRHDLRCKGRCELFYI